MACDVLVHFSSKPPTKKQVGEVLEDYLGSLATEIKWDQDRYFATLHGEYSHPFRRQEGIRESRILSGPRWFEVWVKGKTVDVITRRQDECTMVVARGFATLLARYWEGEVDDAV